MESLLKNAREAGESARDSSRIRSVVGKEACSSARETHVYDEDGALDIHACTGSMGNRGSSLEQGQHHGRKTTTTRCAARSSRVMP